VESDRTAGIFFEVVPHKIWGILYRQVKSIDFDKDQLALMTELLLNSLKLVENEFFEDLPLNQQALTHYLQQKYLSALDEHSTYEFNPEHGSVWGKAFLYFRAGRTRQVVELL
jgi:hypothetical protein